MTEAVEGAKHDLDFEGWVCPMPLRWTVSWPMPTRRRSCGLPAK